jgi:hypothetical protein
MNEEIVTELLAQAKFAGLLSVLYCEEVERGGVTI